MINDTQSAQISQKQDKQNALKPGNALRGTIKTLLNDGKEITTPSEISLTLKFFLRTYFKKLSQSLSLISKCF